ncbi:MAG: FAD-dependent oxidoreductase [Chloroflexi bacterium]|uniref:ferredoxin--NADP(+) reductase n=1 Tax=Candidatus Chlorohelix allophototropha TaxID=3003348 RepID=A0A8T7M890_9CHLR|nr:FAD-dependent oxidoreductase [Chloroflexota bacterium]WJW68263.1 FAD-dependent oxidoreductase [Chloroflexota bacterium L227-S17]
MEQKLGTESRPLRVAIIGAGPAGFYATEALFKTSGLVVQVDMFNRFPTPYGLVREGVAPDHQSIKAVTRIYDKTAENPNFRYFGNVTLGKDVTHADLKKYYDQIIYAVGAQSDRKMGIPGEDLENSYPATVFVGWYNAHPDYCDLEFDLSCERVAVVGNGNVAMDVARILVTEPDELAKTDIADYTIEKLRQSKVKEVILLGRRGPVQAAFTHPELKEFGELPNVTVVIDPAALELDEHSAAALPSDKSATKNVETMRQYATNPHVKGDRKVEFRYLVSPVEVIGKDGKVAAVKIEKNRLEKGADGSIKAVGTGEYETLEVGMIFRSVGYKGAPLADVPFDSKSGIIPNVAGRVTESAGGAVVAGEYVVGWAKRGPSGIIGTNKPDSAATVVSAVQDVSELDGIADENRNPVLIENLLQERGIKYVTYADWHVINKAEIARGEQKGSPRVKFYRVPDMLEVINK